MRRGEKKQENAITHYQVNFNEGQERENYRKVGHGFVLNMIIQHILYNVFIMMAKHKNNDINDDIAHQRRH